ncbi:MAG: 4-hydroxybenzoate octaprenyltransferase [Legionellales bacterium]|nr:4-hydroxybenzoate octaprenyltransferase [Legionellales bacterium]|tara:strand:- start:1195 stop:2067 length:873 start_codon:yes stop_codon:yes gene_type:complete
MNHLTLRAYISLLRLDKPVGITLLLWPTWQTAWLINPSPLPSLVPLAYLTVGVILMRSTGCIINDLCDRNIDGHVQRTQQRPLVTGAVSVRMAYGLACIGFMISAYIALQLPILCFWLAIPAAILTCIYPMSKRFFVCPQLILGLVFGACPVLISTAAFTGTLSELSWPLLLSATVWPMAYDTLYAIEDRPDDQHLPIHSSAQWLGRFDLVGVILCSLMWGMSWCYIAWIENNLWLFSATVLSGLGLIPHLIRTHQKKPHAAFDGFLYHQYSGGFIWLALVIHRFMNGLF